MRLGHLLWAMAPLARAENLRIIAGHCPSWGRWERGTSVQLVPRSEKLNKTHGSAADYFLFDKKENERPFGSAQARVPYFQRPG